MLVGNHSGGVPADGGMIIASLFFSIDPPRAVHGMVEKFAQEWPFVSTWFNRVGQLPGLPEHAIRLLNDGRLLMVFPEGARGLGKLYKDRYHLSHFGTGFMRIALQTGTPVIPLAFIGGEEAMPTMFHAKRLARLVGAPYWPVPPYLAALPAARSAARSTTASPCTSEGTGNEPDEVVEGYVEQVKSVINLLVTRGRAVHEQRKSGGNLSESTP
jgi:1-acyl-sn-glycerol-3-phosphate acyltransferase